MLDEAGVRTPPRIGRYSLRAVIGTGAFSVVMLAFDEENKFSLACKVVPKDRLHSGDLHERFETEVHIFQQLSHPGIVKLFDLLKDEHNYYIFMEYCPNGELFQFIVDNGNLTESQGRFVVREILETLQYIHSRGVAHRDMKPENLLLSDTGHVKLSDFGLSKFVGSSGMCETPCGSPCYASPECLSGEAYNAMTSDVWSTGVILFAMLTGQLPWTKRNQVQLFQQIRAGKYNVPEFLSESCREFIRGLMTVDITKRLTIEQALQHPWMVAEPRPGAKKESGFKPFVSVKKVDNLFDETDYAQDLVVAGDLLKTRSSRKFSIEKVVRSLMTCGRGPEAPLSLPFLAKKANQGMGVRVVKELPPVKAPNKVSRDSSHPAIRLNTVESKMRANPLHKRAQLMSQSLFTSKKP